MLNLPPRSAAGACRLPTTQAAAAHSGPCEPAGDGQTCNIQHATTDNRQRAIFNMRRCRCALGSFRAWSSAKRSGDASGTGRAGLARAQEHILEGSDSLARSGRARACAGGRGSIMRCLCACAHALCMRARLHVCVCAVRMERAGVATDGRDWCQLQPDELQTLERFRPWGHTPARAYKQKAARSKQAAGDFK